MESNYIKVHMRDSELRLLSLFCFQKLLLLFLHLDKHASQSAHRGERTKLYSSRSCIF